MLSESLHVAVRTAQNAVPVRFPIELWKQAATAAGGISIAEPQIRTARQQCRTQSWSGDPLLHFAEKELVDIIRQLSGRLV
jgi:hypothetical protein